MNGLWAWRGRTCASGAKLPKAEALAEAKRWLRSLTFQEAKRLAAEVSGGSATRGASFVADETIPPATKHPYEDPDLLGRVHTGRRRIVVRSRYSL